MNNEQDLIIELERYVDKHGLLHVLTALESLCYEKAEHVKSTWQDQALARTWTRAGAAILKSSSKVAELDLPE